MSSTNIPRPAPITLKGDDEAIADDLYEEGEVDGKFKTLEQKLKRLEYFKNQQPGQTTVEDAHIEVLESEQDLTKDTVH